MLKIYCCQRLSVMLQAYRAFSEHHADHGAEVDSLLMVFMWFSDLVYLWNRDISKTGYSMNETVSKTHVRTSGSEHKVLDIRAQRHDGYDCREAPVPNVCSCRKASMLKHM